MTQKQSDPPSLGALIDRAQSQAVGTQAFMVVDGQGVGYGEFFDRMARLRTVFAAKGLGEGAHVGILTRSPHDMALILLAGLQASLAVINLNTDLSPSERRVAISAARLTHLFVDREFLDSGELGVALTVIEADGSASESGLMKRLFGRSEPKRGPTGLHGELATAEPATAVSVREDPEMTALMLFTSGTTSQPKVVELSRRNLAAQLATFLAVYDYGPDCRILNPLPLHFTDGILHGPIITLISGATLFRPKSFDFTQLELMLASVYRDRITHFIVVPALLSMMDRLHDKFDDALATPDLRYLRSSGDTLPAALWRSVQDRFKVRVVNTYGMSETVCEALYCGPSDDRFRVGTIGKPVDCEVRIVGEQGEILTRGHSGELLIRGDNIMKGYLDQPDLTSSTVVDGWLKTGDLAVQDDDGFVSIVGRKKSLIISGGVNIQPQDVVDAMLDHPGVAEAHALGLPDPVFNEIVACAVVPRHPGLTVAELATHCRGLLAAYKVPRRILILPELPRSPAGKVLTRELADLFQQSEAGLPLAGDLEAEVIAIAAEVFRCSPADLRPASDPRNTLGWDSLAHMGLIAAVEHRFGIRLAARDVLRVRRLEHLVDVVRTHAAAR